MAFAIPNAAAILPGSSRRAFLAAQLPRWNLDEIVKGLGGITADTALRLAAFLGTDAQSWLNLQFDDELAVARCDG